MGTTNKIQEGRMTYQYITEVFRKHNLETKRACYYENGMSTSKISNKNMTAQQVPWKILHRLFHLGLYFTTTTRFNI